MGCVLKALIRAKEAFGGAGALSLMRAMSARKAKGGVEFWGGLKTAAIGRT